MAGIEPELHPFTIVPSRMLEGVGDDGERAAFTEREWYTKLGKLTERICREKTGDEAAMEIYNAVKISFGTLEIKYEPTEHHPEGIAFRGIETFAKRRGDCDELSYLFTMMARHAGLAAYVAEVLVDDKGNAMQGEKGHTCAAVFVKSPKPPPGAYEKFEKDVGFRRKTLENLGIADSGDLHMILIDLANQRFGVQYQRVTVQSDNRTNAMYHAESGDIYREHGKFDDAIRECKKAIEIDPNYAPAYDHFGSILVEQNLLGDAIRKYEKAIEIDPNYATAHYNLGVVYWRIGTRTQTQAWLKDAIREYKKAIEIAPNFAQAHYNLGNIYLEQNLLREALSELRKYTKLKPGDREAKQQLRELEKRLKQKVIQK